MSSSRLLLATLMAFVGLGSVRGDDSASELFEQRIMPIFRSPKPSSCVQCHLASVDLKDYILPTQEATFRSLLAQGLVDPEKPHESKILRLIEMGEEDPDALSRRIHAKTRQAEYEAFAAWIEKCCQDPSMTSLEQTRDIATARPARPDAVIRHARKDRVLDSFVRHVWSQRMRCFPCHTPGELQAGNPAHTKPRQRYEDFKRTYGGRMNLFQATPEQTLKSLLAKLDRPTHGDALPMINLDDPRQSLLVQKPTAKVPGKQDDGTRAQPSSTVPVSHVGGLKMHVDDVAYKSFLTWMEDLAMVRNEQYASADQLPQDLWYPTKHVIRLKDLPEAWPALARVQIVVMGPATQSSDSEPAENQGSLADAEVVPGREARIVARTQSLVTPRRFVNGTLFAMRQDQAEDSYWDSAGVVLPNGEYRLKVYVDNEDRLSSSATTWLGEAELAVETTFQATWGEGFKNAQVISLSKVLQPALSLNSSKP